MTLKDPSYRTLLLPEMQLLSPPPSTGGSKASAGTTFWNRQRLVDTLGLQDDPRFDMEWFEAVSSVVMNNSFIIARKGFSIAGNGAKCGSGVYPTASLFNHSCAPNAEWAAGLRTLDGAAFNSLVVKATKRIKKGEQIFIAYIRQMRLHRFGFECRCICCEMER